MLKDLVRRPTDASSAVYAVAAPRASRRQNTRIGSGQLAEKQKEFGRFVSCEALRRSSPTAYFWRFGPKTPHRGIARPGEDPAGAAERNGRHRAGQESHQAPEQAGRLGDREDRDRAFARCGQARSNRTVSFLRTQSRRRQSRRSGSMPHAPHKCCNGAAAQDPARFCRSAPWNGRPGSCVRRLRRTPGW